MPGTFTDITGPQWIFSLSGQLVLHSQPTNLPYISCESNICFAETSIFSIYLATLWDSIIAEWGLSYFQGGNWTDSVSRPREVPAPCHPLLCCRAAPYHSRQLNVSEGTSVSPVQYLLPSIIPRFWLYGWITVAAKFCVKKFPRQRPLEGIYESSFPESAVRARRSMFQSHCIPAGLWYQICHG